MLTRFAITRRADDDGVDASVVERDYVLAHIVAQLHRANPTDGGQLVFKGGTALRLVHIGDYRYSADLDFTVIGGGGGAATAAMVEVLNAAREHAGFPVLELTDGDSPIAYVGPLEAGRPRHLKLDISDSEVVETVEQRTILDGVWSDLPEAVPFAVYPIDEIAAEKLRCIIQRVQCRDLYDIFRLVEDMGVSLDEVRPLFAQKATAKGLDPATFAEKFEDRIDRYKGRWDREMPDHLADPPRFDDVVRVVRRRLRTAGLVGS
ncbi:MAG: nucleotidyl transferase AbiEii/AbiGii toxin family protein [Mycobacterium sp.]|uniref:nucleotidyl transferase AbiEii/AbiGii toxin family protein n=1 Tax=Mycobacterium sp. TaxID=1785 RepID=UPI003F99A218